MMTSVLEELTKDRHSYREPISLSLSLVSVFETPARF